MNKNPKKRTEYIGIRLTPEEKERIFARAMAAGMSVTLYLIGNALRDEEDGQSC